MSRYSLLICLAIFSFTQGIAQRTTPAVDSSVFYIYQQQMVLKKALLIEARKKGITVSDSELDNALDRKMGHFIHLYGSRKKLEKATGKKLSRLRSQQRKMLREDMVAEKMQSHILGNITIRRAEVRAFFNKIPLDSLPLYPADVRHNIPAHIANLKNDYARIRGVALQQKKAMVMNKWLTAHLPANKQKKHA